MPYRRTTAFTLIELLVVISIIALLIAILLPALTKARELTQKSQCLANQRTVGQALTTYAAESKGIYPPSFERQNANGSPGGKFADAYDLRNAFPYTGANAGRIPLAMGLAVDSGAMPPGTLGSFHCPSVDTLSHDNPAMRGVMMDLDDPAIVFKGGSAWDSYPLHRIISSYNYRGTSYQHERVSGGRPMKLEECNSDFLLVMDTPDTRHRGLQSLYNAHQGYNFVTGDGSGRYILDSEYGVDAIALERNGNVDGRRGNAEKLYQYVIDNE